jgi:acetate kinase
MSDTILVINAGSSSLKFSVYGVAAAGIDLACKGQIEGLGTRPHLNVRDRSGAVLADADFSPEEVRDIPAAIGRVGAWLRERFGGELPMAVGHRVVHGGSLYSAPVVVDDEVYATLERLIPLAPLHQPGNLTPIRVMRERFPQLLQVACFDTAFHRSHPEVAERYALPEELYRDGVRRYGFHGLSYEYIARTLPTVAPEIAEGAVVVAHLGSGASLCAVSNGRSMDSTMGFTALDGVPMGTRCGQIDPGVLLFLMTEKGYGAREIERLLYHESGLKGLSGVSNDVRDLLASSAPGARLALDYFVYRIGREIGSLAAALGGIDGLVFTAGIGENSAEMRSRICERAAWLGARLDDAANHGGKTCISAAGSHPSVWVIPTNEERIIAEHTLALWRRVRGTQPIQGAEE